MRPDYYTVKVCPLSMTELSSVVMESGLLRCPCMINTCHAMHWESFIRSIRLAALIGLLTVSSCFAWVLVSLEIQYHPAPSYPAAAASRRHNFPAITFSDSILPSRHLFWPTLHMHSRLRPMTLQHQDFHYGVSDPRYSQLQGYCPARSLRPLSHNAVSRD